VRGNRGTRYADCPTTEAEVLIDALPAIVWAPDKEHRILRRRLAEHHANTTATLAGIKVRAEASS
jgi:hypothetical protein